MKVLSGRAERRSPGRVSETCGEAGLLRAARRAGWEAGWVIAVVTELRWTGHLVGLHSNH